MHDSKNKNKNTYLFSTSLAYFLSFSSYDRIPEAVTLLFAYVVITSKISILINYIIMF